MFGFGKNPVCRTTGCANANGAVNVATTPPIPILMKFLLFFRIVTKNTAAFPVLPYHSQMQFLGFRSRTSHPKFSQPGNTASAFPSPWFSSHRSRPGPPLRPVPCFVQVLVETATTLPPRMLFDLASLSSAVSSVHPQIRFRLRRHVICFPKLDSKLRLLFR